MKGFGVLQAAGAMAVVVASLTGLAACGHSPPTRLHMLQAVPPAQPAERGAYAGEPIQVGEVHVPPQWDRLELIRESAPGQYQVEDFDRWAAPLARASRQALTEDLVARLPAGAVIFSDATRPNNAREVRVDILSFRVAPGTATMLVSFAIQPANAPANGAANGQTSNAATQAVLQTPASDGSPAATAQAFSALLGQLADRMAAVAAR